MSASSEEAFQGVEWWQRPGALPIQVRRLPSSRIELGVWLPVSASRGRMFRAQVDEAGLLPLLQSLWEAPAAVVPSLFGYAGLDSQGWEGQEPPRPSILDQIEITL